MVKTLKGVARNLGSILLPSYERGGRRPAIGFQIMLGGVVTFASVANVVSSVVFGSSLMITAGIFVAIVGVATILELGYLRTNLGRHERALKRIDS